jgi:hypothetical protein
LVTDVPGSNVEPDVVPLVVESRSGQGKLSVGWLARPRPALPGVEVAAPDAAPDAYYIGEGRPDADLEAVRRAVEAGAGVVVDGPPEWLAGTPLEDLLPARPADGGSPSLQPVQPEVVVPGHPALLGLSGSLPEGYSAGYHELVSEAAVVARYGPGRPMVVEGSFGRGRVVELLAPPAYRRRLASWSGQPRWLAGLLAYAAKLSDAETRRLLAAPDADAMAPLRRLPAVPLRVSAANTPLLVAPGLPATREVQLHNESGQVMPLVTLTMADLPAGVSARFSANSFALLPGQERRVTVTLECLRSMKDNRTAALRVAGWGVEPSQIELPLEVGR